MTAAAVQAAQEGGALADIALTFGVDWPHLAAQTISFAIVCVVLYRLCYTPILQMLEARRQQIAAGLANAQKIERELAAIAASRQEILAKADGEARHLIEEARVGAAHVHADLTRKAKKAAEDLLERARQEAMHDRARLYAEFRSEAGRLVAQTTAAVTGKILTPDDHRRIAEDAARQLHS